MPRTSRNFIGHTTKADASKHPHHRRDRLKQPMLASLLLTTTAATLGGVALTSHLLTSQVESARLHTKLDDMQADLRRVIDAYKKKKG